MAAGNSDEGNWKSLTGDIPALRARRSRSAQLCGLRRPILAGVVKIDADAISALKCLIPRTVKRALPFDAPVSESSLLWRASVHAATFEAGGYLST
ncbi:hypothetical protein KCP73_01790 [Salmonella enterica subsp. enterica]|nr:hypothetical protein KCP73_01790 [Salmonella enterica subsp. enterica]